MATIVNQVPIRLPGGVWLHTAQLTTAGAETTYDWLIGNRILSAQAIPKASVTNLPNVDIDTAIGTASFTALTASSVFTLRAETYEV